VTTAAVLGVDGGNSKTDVVIVSRDGRLLTGIRGPSVSHQAVGLEHGMNQLSRLVEQAADRAGIARRPVAELGVYCLAGADYASDTRLLRREIGKLSLARDDIVLNDTFAALRAGAERSWGVALVCGQGINGAAVAPSGRIARFAGLGPISGDWGGGGDIGLAGLGAAVRGRDGRGQRTSLERLVPDYFGLPSPSAVTRALYIGRLPESRLAELTPVVFRAAADGDLPARDIVDRLADELIAMAGALIRRLGLRRRDPEIVLAGGVFDAEDARFIGRIEAGIPELAAAARLVRLREPPVLGAALLGLDRLQSRSAIDRAAEARLRAELAAFRVARS
jgi:N-acetylglucosamine kinase-like BadF-type ATPase